jgi:hypothetical protein
MHVTAIFKYRADIQILVHILVSTKIKQNSNVRYVIGPELSQEFKFRCYFKIFIQIKAVERFAAQKYTSFSEIFRFIFGFSGINI